MRSWIREQEISNHIIPVYLLILVFIYLLGFLFYFLYEPSQYPTMIHITNIILITMNARCLISEVYKMFLNFFTNIPPIRSLFPNARNVVGNEGLAFFRSKVEVDPYGAVFKIGILWRATRAIGQASIALTVR